MVEVAAFGAHLPPYAVWHAVSYLGADVDSFIGKHAVYLIGKLLEVVLVLFLFCCKQGVDFREFPRASETEGKCFKFGFHMVQSQTVCQRSVEIVCLSGDLHLLVRSHALKGTHVVQAVSQLDENGPDIVLHGLEELAEVVHLLGMAVFLLFLLCDYVHQECDIVTISFPHIFQGIVCILHYIVQKCCNDRVRT